MNKLAALSSDLLPAPAPHAVYAVYDLSSVFEVAAACLQTVFIFILMLVILPLRWSRQITLYRGSCELAAFLFSRACRPPQSLFILTHISGHLSLQLTVCLASIDMSSVVDYSLSLSTDQLLFKVGRRAYNGCYRCNEIFTQNYVTDVTEAETH